MPNIIIKKSSKQGKGVFALKYFEKGEVILHNDITKLKRYSVQDLKKLIKEKKISKDESEHCDYIGDRKYVVDFSPMSYVNHSCNPNAYVGFKKLGKQKLIALKPIEKGSEITYDYSIQAVDNIDAKNPWKIKCNCGSKKCRKYIQGDFFRLPQKIQREKLPFLPTWVKVRYKYRLSKLNKQ